MAPKPPEYLARSSIQCSARRMARVRMLFDPWRAHHFSARSRVRKKLRQEKILSLSNWYRTPTPGLNNSRRLKPAGTGRAGFIEWTMDIGMTNARVHEDIS